MEEVVIKKLGIIWRKADASAVKMSQFTKSNLEKLKNQKLTIKYLSTSAARLFLEIMNQFEQIQAQRMKNLAQKCIQNRGKVIMALLFTKNKRANMVNKMVASANIPFILSNASIVMVSIARHVNLLFLPT
jgi:hypothetical protein